MDPEIDSIELKKKTHLTCYLYFHIYKQVNIMYLLC